MWCVLAVANGIEKYPLALIKEVRHQIAEMMIVKRRHTFASVLEEDRAAQRFTRSFWGLCQNMAISAMMPAVAQSRFGRREIARKLLRRNRKPSVTEHDRPCPGDGLQIEEDHKWPRTIRFRQHSPKFAELFLPPVRSTPARRSAKALNIISRKSRPITPRPHCKWRRMHSS